MEQHEIIMIARQAGYTPFEALKWERALTNFAKLVEERTAAKEREACALVCDKKDEVWARAGLWNPTGEYKECAAAIRARGEAQ